MVYTPKRSQGFKCLRTWAQAGDIYRKTKDFTHFYLDKYKDMRLIAHMNDSARSVQRNIEEGYKRATTKEYIEFLGFSRGSLEELKGDFEELKREYIGRIRVCEGKDRGADKGMDKGVEDRIEELLKLIYGEDCMLGRQIKSLEDKMLKEKTLSKDEMIRRMWRNAELREKKFWNFVKARRSLSKDSNSP